MGGLRIIDYEIDTIHSQTLLDFINKNLDVIERVQILYIANDNEFLTENISLNWLGLVDAHTFYNGLELKKVQKQKYNFQNYNIIVRITQMHTSR